MLSRTAESLYWMARYIERAENVARVLDVSYSMGLLPTESDNEAQLWTDALEISGNEALFEEMYGEVNAENVIKHLTLDKENLSSIYSSLYSARENARAVRVALTSETWENINGLWLELSEYLNQDLTKARLSEFCEWVRIRSHLFRGVCFGTMLRDEAFSFVRLGTFVERADNTARLLNTKFDQQLVQKSNKGQVDYYEWSSVLRSVSAFQAYQKVYSHAIDPMKVSELLVLRHDMPRSLHACYDEIAMILEDVAEGRKTEAERLSGELHAKLHFSKMPDLIKGGLNKFLEDFIAANRVLGDEIYRGFLNTNI